MVLGFGNWKVNVEIFEVRQGGLVKANDKAKRVVGKVGGILTGENFYKLKKRKIRMAAASFADIIGDDKGKSTLYLWSPAPNYYFPLRMDRIKDLLNEFYKFQDYKARGYNLNEKGEMVKKVNGLEDEFLKDENGKPMRFDTAKFFPTDVDVINWEQTEMRRANDMWKKTNNLDKWLPLILILVAAIGCVMILQTVQNGVTESSRNFAAGAASFQKTAEAQLKIDTEIVAIMKALGIKEGAINPDGSSIQIPPF